jgi:hypothetical protein
MVSESTFDDAILTDTKGDRSRERVASLAVLRDMFITGEDILIEWRDLLKGWILQFSLYGQRWYTSMLVADEMTSKDLLMGTAMNHCPSPTWIKSKIS